MGGPEFTTVERIPQWAVCYIVDADDSGLTPDDRKLVDDYVDYDVDGLEEAGVPPEVLEYVKSTLQDRVHDKVDEAFEEN